MKAGLLNGQVKGNVGQARAQRREVGRDTHLGGIP
jgi:hypothetical protein